MKKIITSQEAERFMCPVRARPDYREPCVGSKCMKWEEETERKEVTIRSVVTENEMSRPVTGSELRDVPTGKGFCGL